MHAITLTVNKLIPGKDNKLISPVIVHKERSLIHQKPQLPHFNKTHVSSL